VLNKQVEVDLNETSESLDLDDPNPVAASTTENKKNIGFVIEILEPVHSRQCIGTILPSQARSPRLQPRDPKIPLVEIVFQSQEEKMKLTLDNQNTLLRVQITEWFDEKPIGKIVEVIGKVDDLAAETKAILLQNNLDVTEYAKEILDALPSATTYEIPDTEFKYRQDIRDMCVFTIDPLTAKDLDDALSCRVLANGNYEIGVHISDVSFFLKEESDLDVIVKDKATSIYLSNSVYHMLPRQLCMLCSLLPGQDKLSFSVFFEITTEGEVVSTYFTKSILNSCTQLAYEHAQEMIENPSKEFTEDDLPQIHNNYTSTQLSGIVNTLHKIALKLREKRMENGALKIDQPKLSFQLNPENGRPESYCVYPIKDSNRMIEDFMLLANESVAEYIYKKFPDISILRCHLPPNANAIIKLKQFFDKNLINFDIATSKDIQRSIGDILDNADKVEATKAVVNVLAAKPMTRARYFCSNTAEQEVTGDELPREFKHFALSIPIYTHFTSPIRRYADVLVHR
jgi:DIS3-like exonuclease 2